MKRCTTEGPKSWREGRRLRAWELFQQGWRQRRIAQALGVTEGAVSHWLLRARQAGRNALHARPHPGPPPRLSPEQQDRVLSLLRQGAAAGGFRGDRWTQKRVREVIRREVGVTYHPSHISRLLARWNWSRQKPAHRARQRDEAAVGEWREQRYPALIKRGRGARRGATLVFVDEAGFYLLPTAVRTYAPRAETPLLAETVTHDHLSVISGVPAEGRLFVQIHEGAITGGEVVLFLLHLERHLRGPLIVIWDGASIHRGQEVKQFLAAGHGARIHLEQFPGYAPELNPDEGVWHPLKDKELANVACADLRQLRQELQQATRRLRHRPETIRGYFREAGYL